MAAQMGGLFFLRQGPVLRFARPRRRRPDTIGSTLVSSRDWVSDQKEIPSQSSGLVFRRISILINVLLRLILAAE